MGNLRICILTQQYDYFWSGVGTYATYLVDRLAEKGHRVIVVTHQEPMRAARARHKNIQLITVKKSRYDPSVGQWFTLSLKYARLLRAHPALKECDLYHFTDAREALFMPPLTAPAVGTMNDYYCAVASKNPLSFRKSYKDWIPRYCYYQAVRSLEPKALRKLSAVICNSHFVKETVRVRYRIPEDKLHVVYYGIKETVAAAHTSAQRLEGYPALLFVGANFQRKGLPAVIKALSLLTHKYPQARLYVVGHDANAPQMQKLCAAYGVVNSVRFLGWVSNQEVLQLYRKATFFVMPSLIEGFGFTFLEAMSAGIPVIAGNAGGTKELITDGVNGVLVSPNNPGQLFERIALLLEDGPLREKMVRNAHATLKGYTWDESVDNTLKVYETIRMSKCISQ